MRWSRTPSRLTHETSWEVGVSADFAVNFDQTLHDNLGHFRVCLEVKSKIPLKTCVKMFKSVRFDGTLTKAYFKRLRRKMTSGNDSRNLCGPVDGRGAKTPPNLSNIHAFGAFKRFKCFFGPRACKVIQREKNVFVTLALHSQSWNRVMFWAQIDRMSHIYNLFKCNVFSPRFSESQFGWTNEKLYCAFLYLVTIEAAFRLQHINWWLCVVCTTNIQ